jgi:hypothetical protein
LNKIYVAISKSSGSIISGVKGQYAFEDKKHLNQCMAQALGYQARKYNKKAREFYDIYLIDVDRAISLGIASEVK